MCPRKSFHPSIYKIVTLLRALHKHSTMYCVDTYRYIIFSMFHKANSLTLQPSRINLLNISCKLIYASSQVEVNNARASSR